MPSPSDMYRNGELHFSVVNAPRRPLSDLYHHLMRGSWGRLILLWFVAYMIAIGAFGILFWLGGDCIENATPGSFSDAFWFSVQTFSTIGYGAMSPKTLWAHILVTVESFVGLTGVALATALMYSKFARPKARIAFSDKLIVSSRNGEPTLQVRLANERGNKILHPTLRLSVLIEETSAEGVTMGRMERLALVRDRAPMFSMTWTGIHLLNQDSPLFGLNIENVQERVVMILVTFEGTDDAYMQTVFADRIFAPDDIAFGYQFADVISRERDRLLMDHRFLHEIVPQQDAY